MSFPYHDNYWVGTLEFLQQNLTAGESILAPDDFWRPFPKIFRYLNTRLKPDADYDWAVIHKGQLVEFSEKFLHRMTGEMSPVFANDVFVIWSKSNKGAIPKDSPHVQSMFGMMEELGKPSNATPSQNEIDPVLPDPGEIVRFDSISLPELKEQMNGFWKHGGYKYETHRDQLYYQEISRLILDFLGDISNQTILDMCCGEGRELPELNKANTIVSMDLSEVAVGQAAAKSASNPVYSFSVMDAHRLPFEASTFDSALFVDAIEHVHDIESVFLEVARVLKPGGRFFITVANTDSLHLRMTRKMGYPMFKTNYQHIREFAYGETCGLLEKNGLRVGRSEGLFLYPYWGIPGVDQFLRNVNDDDPEIVDLMMELGRKVGPEHAYAFVILAEKAL